MNFKILNSVVIFAMMMVQSGGCASSNELIKLKEAVILCKENYEKYKLNNKPVNYDRIFVDEFYDGSMDISFTRGDPGTFKKCDLNYKHYFGCSFTENMDLLFMVDQDFNPLVEDKDLRIDLRNHDVTEYWLIEKDNDIVLIDSYVFRGERDLNCNNQGHAEE